MEIWTDGRITPDDSLLQASAILRHHLDVFVNYDDSQVEFDETSEEVSQENTRLKKMRNRSVNEIELPVRAANCLNNANITTAGELARKTEAEMLNNRNCVKRALNELSEKEDVRGWFGDVATRSGDRQGGYVRKVKLGLRPSDSAPMAYIEWVDQPVTGPKIDLDEKPEKKAEKK